MAEYTQSADVLSLCPACSGRACKTRHVVRAERVAVCSACGCWYRQPRPTADDLAKIYDKDYYNSWGLEDNAQTVLATKRATFAPLLQAVESAIAPSLQRPWRILDVGAATGLLLDLARQRGLEPYAVELNPFSAGILKNRFGDDRVFQGELTQCSFAPGFFHAITMTDVIEHVLDVPGTLQAAWRLLQPGGAILMTTPRIDSLSRWLMQGKWLHFKAEHIQYFTARSIVQAATEAGFERVQVSSHRKQLTMNYLATQMKIYPHPVLSPLVKLASHILPAGLQNKPMSYRCGEMVVLARKGGESC